MIKRSLIKNINLPAIYKIISRKSSLKLARDLGILESHFNYCIKKNNLSDDLKKSFSELLNISDMQLQEILDYFYKLNNEKIDNFLKYKLALYYLITKLNPELIVPDVSKEIKGLEVLKHFNGSEINIIENIRLANGMAIEDLASILNFKSEYINSVEKNKRTFALNNFILLINHLNYSNKEYNQILRLHELLLQSDKSNAEKNTLFLLGILIITNPNLKKDNDKILTKKR